MKRTTILMLTVIFFLAGAGLVFAEMHQKSEDESMHQGSEMEQTHPSEEQMEWFCPMCGAPKDRGMGRGMMQNKCPMGGKGMMHHGKGMYHGWSRSQCPKSKAKQMAPLNKDEAKTLMKNYVAANPNLKIGEITEKDDMYIGEIVTKDGSLVENLVVDKNTGWMKRTY